MSRIRAVFASLAVVSALLIGQPAPPPLNPNSIAQPEDSENGDEELAASGIDWSQVEPSIADWTGVYPLPNDTADPWLEPEKFTDCAQVACVALTFDDGPLPGYTERILEILNEYDAPATFFLVGQLVKRYPELVLETIAQGHEVAAHSYSHSRLTELGGDSLRRDFDRTNDILNAVTGHKPPYYRPPYGMHNQRVREAAQMPTIMWSIDPQDWRKANSASEVASYVLARAHPGAIVLFHDKMDKTAVALPQIIAGLRAQGYELVTVAEILGSALIPEAVYRSGLIPPFSDPISG